MSIAYRKTDEMTHYNNDAYVQSKHPTVKQIRFLTFAKLWGEYNFLVKSF